MNRNAYISPDGVYRYRLTRSWISEAVPGRHGYVTFILLNPSTADGEVDDPTVRRCINFAKRLGMDGLMIANLFALRASNPRALLTAKDPIGPENDANILGACLLARQIIAGWGVQEGDLGHLMAKRIAEVRSKLAAAGDHPMDLYALGETRSGAPRHPLYVPAGAEPLLWPRTQVASEFHPKPRRVDRAIERK
jgi:hypothetical protein